MADKRDILIRLLGEETVSRMAGKAGDGLDKFGDQLDATEKDAHDLDRQIGEVERDLATLAVAFARTSDAAERMDISKAMRKQQAELRKLTKAKDLLGNVDEAGKQFGAGLLGGIAKVLPGGLGNAFSSLPPQVQGPVAAAGAAIGVTLAGAVGAALTAGILLAVSGGVLVAGIKAAADNPKVQAAWKTFGDRAKKAFADFGKPFEGPLIRAAQTFGDALERMAPTLKRMGESMAPIIDKLAPALAEMAEKSLPNIEKAMEAGKPLWDTLAEHAPKIGEAIGKFFDSISEGGPGANKFLGDFLTLLESNITMLGIVIGTLARIYGKAREVWVGVAGVFAEGVKVVLAALGKIISGAAAAFGWIPGIGPKLKTAAAEFEKFRIKANAELDKIKDETVKITIEQHFKTFGKPGTSVGGIGGSGFKGLATGGPVKAGQPYLVGEDGPELITPSRDGFVHDAQATARMLARSGAADSAAPVVGGGGRLAVDVRLSVGSGGGATDRAFADMLLGLIRRGVIQLTVVNNQVKVA